ncbi:MAG: CDP-alcohol phosphatidyltransferase family protein [Candidatus Bipolaricaulota bacterium]|nr:CDP-alcohol phosphatidyltransferase family protein [Candidatus Bipolaricaulota bacterium]MDW8126217.1 CDP-alcohol phosphatidyltransferase family protein [Candidatus Bipolaricaulota bacterium]
MSKREYIPDWLTASRILVALGILALVPFGPEALDAVAGLLLLGWTTDMVDGRLARRFEKGPSWLGEHDFQIDMLMVLASAVFLTATGLVPARVGIPYICAAILISLYTLRFRDFLKFKSVTMLLAFPWVFTPFVLALFYAPVAAYAGLAWMILALVFDWRRFLGVVGDFLSGARAYLRR